MTRERVILSLTGGSARERAETIRRARRRGFASFAVPDLRGNRPRREETWYRTRESGYVPVAGTRATGPVSIRSVGTPRDLVDALRAARVSGSVAIRWTGARVIPLENALAARALGTSVWVVARGARDLPAALGALEIGADRVVVGINRVDEVDEIDLQFEATDRTPIRWGFAVVDQIRAVGLSDRVIVDTTALLGPTEGLLVGSSAAVLFHVASEAKGSAFSGPRPFRVNAGSPHLYVLMADGTTRYLSELEAGDRVRVFDGGRSGRSVHVGRLKIERRPMLLVGATYTGRRATIFLQEAETVRLTGATHSMPVTSLEVGDRVRVAALPPARHLGRIVDERILEL